jgi:N-acetylglucosaminyldiphosphoundecaprenol N-acetyl-beta-D-mannosaminyltransferase
LLDRLEAHWAAGRRGLLVGHHNLNSLSLRRRDPHVRAFYEQCDRCYVDGVPVLWLMRFAGLPATGAVRFSLMDALPELLGWAEAHGRTVFCLGGAPETVARVRAWAEVRFGALRLGLHHGYFEDDTAVVERINRFRPDLLLIGMGMPRQERWMLAHRHALDAGALLQAGGTLDYYAGVQPRPPAWMSRVGLGGVYRLARSPRRLARRYLVEPWRLLGPALRLRRELRREMSGDVPNDRSA